MRLIIEILLGIASLLLGSMWWALFKRDFYLKCAVQDETVLNGLLTKELLETPSERIAIYAAKHELGGYAMSLHLLAKADRESIRIPTWMFGVLLVLLLIGSYVLGWLYFAVNLGLICVAGLFTVPESAKANANEQIASTAVILYGWNADDPVECDAFIQKTPSLSKLYSAVVKIAGESVRESGFTGHSSAIKKPADRSARGAAVNDEPKHSELDSLRARIHAIDEMKRKLDQEMGAKYKWLAWLPWLLAKLEQLQYRS